MHCQHQLIETIKNKCKKNEKENKLEKENEREKKCMNISTLNHPLHKRIEETQETIDQKVSCKVVESVAQIVSQRDESSLQLST